MNVKEFVRIYDGELENILKPRNAPTKQQLHVRLGYADAHIETVEFMLAQGGYTSDEVAMLEDQLNRYREWRRQTRREVYS